MCLPSPRPPRTRNILTRGPAAFHVKKVRNLFCGRGRGDDVDVDAGCVDDGDEIEQDKVTSVCFLYARQQVLASTKKGTKKYQKEKKREG